MADEITVEVNGLAELATALNAIPAQLATRVMRGALHAAGDVMAIAAEATAPVRSGALKEDIVVKVLVTGDLSRNMVIVGPGYEGGKKGARGSDSPGVYGLFVEVGHGPPGSARERRAAKRRGMEVEFGSRDTPAHPWLRPAFEASKEEAVQVFGEYVEAGLEAIAGTL